MSDKHFSKSNVIAKENIVSALLNLIKSKPLSAISITELCNTAGVSRMTFYRNYDSVEEIFEKRLCDYFDAYRKDDEVANISGIFCDEQHMQHYFEYLYRYRKFLDGIIKCGLNNLFLKMITDYVFNKWLDVSDKYTLTAFSGALYNSFIFWANSNYTEDKQLLINNLVELFEPKTRI